MRGTAFVTGGAKRIGRVIAFDLADKGFHIALHYRNSEREADEVAKKIQCSGRKCHLFHCDFNDMDAVTALIPRVFDRFPDCNLLINNSSVFERARLMDTDVRLFDRQFNTNFKAPFFLSRDFARLCSEGQIINILDTKISSPHIEYFVYSLTKKTLFEFTRMAAKELGPSIRVNSISPGLILPSKYRNKEDFKQMEKKIPLKKTGEPKNLISAVNFLIDNDFITGECIFVDGGEHLK